MKKTIVLLLALVMLLAFSSCEESSSTQKNDNGTLNVTDSDMGNDTLEKHEITDEELFAAKLLIAGAKLFNDPITTKVNNVWLYKIESNVANYYNYTFELEAKNSIGVVETKYYGNALSFSSLSEEELKKAKDKINNYIAYDLPQSYFEENEIEGMQKGEKLDADNVYDYFIKNYK